MDRLSKALVPLAVLAGCIVLGYLPRDGVPGLAATAKAIGPYGHAMLINALWIVLPVGALALQKRSLGRALAELGFATNPFRPLFFGFVATSPALIGFALTGHLDHSLTPRAFFILCILSPLAEETLFRAFAFGQLYRNARWSFWAAILVPTVLFASGHMYQSRDPSELAGIFAITALGSLIFAFFFVRLGWTLWAPFALHGFLNTWWTVFTSNQTALGGWSDNIFRFGSIGLAFGLVAAAAVTPALRFLAPAKGAWRADDTSRIATRLSGA